MNTDNLSDLSKIRYERAFELLNEAKGLLNIESYKSANNRAYYAAEKAIKAILIIKGKDSKTHSGVLNLFNSNYIHTPCEFFSRDDLKMLQKMEYIRTASDYDDFYIASKKETVNQVGDAEIILKKVKNFLESEGIL